MGSVGSTSNRHAVRNGLVPSKADPPSQVRSAHVVHPDDGSRPTHPCIRPELPLSPFSRDTRATSNPILTSDATAAAAEYRLLGATQDPRSTGGVGGTIRYADVAQLGTPPSAVRREPLLKLRRPVATENDLRPRSVVSERVASSEIEHRLSDSSSPTPYEFPFVFSRSPFRIPVHGGTGRRDKGTRSSLLARSDRCLESSPTRDRR